jgi:precorrin-3B synthase
MSPQAAIATRGWCPSLNRPMASGDGLIVRLHPPGGVMSAEVAHLIAETARECGNGLLDVTSRGNLQIRGLRPDTHRSLLHRLAGTAFEESADGGKRRLAVVSPLAGIDPQEQFNSLALEAAVEAAAQATQDLPDKTCVAVDGGGRFSLDAIPADVHLSAVAGPGRPDVAIGLGATTGPLWIGTASLANAPPATAAILARFVALRQSGGTRARRIRDGGPDLVAALAEAGHLGPPEVSLPRTRAPYAGILPLDRGRAAILAALPFGRCTSEQLSKAARFSERFGSGVLRLAFTRGILIPDVADRSASALLWEASDAGFVVAWQDPLLAVAACSGRPACASAFTAAPDDARRVARAAGQLLGSGANFHVSACAKGCARSGAADMTLVGRLGGTYSVVIAGSARDPVCGEFPLDEIISRLASVQVPGDLRRAFRVTVS